MPDPRYNCFLFYGLLWASATETTLRHAAAKAAAEAALAALLTLLTTLLLDLVIFLLLVIGQERLDLGLLSGALLLHLLHHGLHILL